MQVILTPTAVPNKFGPGLNGFTNSTPLATQLSAEWFDSVQQEFVNVIIGQGIALDGFQLDQLKQAIDDYSFNSPTITGSLTIDAGGFLEIDGVANVNSAGGFVLKMGSTFAVESGVTFIWADNTVVIGTDNTNNWTINGNVTLGTDAASVINVLGSPTFNETTTMEAALVIAGASGGSLSTDPSAVCQFNGEAQFNGRARVLTSTSVAAGDLSRDGNSNLQWRDSTGTKKAHTSAVGWVRGHGQSASLGTGATLSLNTSAAVAPIVTSDLDVTAHVWLQRAVAGDVVISLIEVGGIGQIGTNRTVRVSATAGTTFDPFVFSRTRSSADTTPRVYQLFIDGNGANITGVEARIVVAPTS